jgi:hypothetical protein
VSWFQVSRIETTTYLPLFLPNFINIQITFVDTDMIKVDIYHPPIVTLTDLTLHKSTYCYEHLMASKLLDTTAYYIQYSVKLQLV